MPSPFEQPFEVVDSQIATLDEVALVRLCNRLVWDDAWRARIPKDKVLISLRTKTPDGGIDADTEAGELQGDHIPAGRTVWQFKKTWKSPADLKTELSREAVRSAFAQGAGYTFMLGQALVPKTHNTRLAAIEKEAKAAGCTGPIRLYSGGQIAAWASSVPAALLELRPELGGWMRADNVLREGRHSIPFEADEARLKIVETIKATLLADDPTTYFARIPGDAGVGKTRLGLEVVRAMDRETLTLFGTSPASTDFFSWVAANEQVQAIVIVDEVDDDETDKYERYAEHCGGRLRLITIGRGKGSAPNVYVLPPLSNDAMEKVVKQAAPSLRPEQARWVVERTGGYVKLAVAVAGCIERGETTFAEMENNRDFRSVITKLLGEGSQEFANAMMVASVLTHVGWDGDAAPEGIAIATFLGLDWPQVQSGLVNGLKAGLVVAKGRYRYVTPELLAVWFAADVWRAHAARILDLFDALPNEASRHALLARLAFLPHIPGVEDALAQLLGADGPFRTIDDVDNDGASRLLHNLARGSPVAAMRTLNRLLHDASQERLLSFERGRRYVSWTLELLLERKETFFEAAFLIRRLAEAENETIGNNATGVWNAIFLTFLAPTEVPALERLSLLEDALASDSITARRLAVQAIGSSLQLSEFGLALRDGPDVPPQRWHPATYGELWGVKRAALRLLDGALEDESEEVRALARQTFTHQARSLVAQQLAPEVCERFERLEGSTDKERRDIWEHIMMVLKYEHELLDDAQKQLLQAAAQRIYGESLPDRIRRYTGDFSSVDWPSDGEAKERPEVIAAKLADEAVGKLDEVEAILPWLFSGEANAVWPFAYRLGVLDEDRTWFDPLVQAAEGQPDTRMLSGFLAGRAASGDAAWCNALLDEWARDPAKLALAVDATARSEPSDIAVTRVLSMLDRGDVVPSELGWLMWGRWTDGVSLSALEQLIARMAADSSAVSIQTALSLVNYALRRPDVTVGIADRAWQLLDNPAGWGHAAMLGYNWEQVASQLVRDNPSRVAQTILRLYAEGEPDFHDDRLKLLDTALQEDPAAVWSKIGDVLLSAGDTYRLMWSLEDTQLVANVQPDVVLGWVRERGEAAAKAVANIIKPSGDVLSDLVRALIAEYPSVVGPVVAMNYFTGSWWGSEVAHLEGKLAEAQQWLSDTDEHVREWVRQVTTSLERQLAEARGRDDEDDIIR